MDLHEPHPWDVDAREARRIQEEMRGRVQLGGELPLDRIRVVAGVDNAYTGRGRAGEAVAVVVILSFPALETIETRIAAVPVTFPYVPGLLTFREAPAILAAFRQVEAVPDVVLFDGQGIAHRRRLGLAAHLGVVLDRPSIGCAKSRLVGEYVEPAQEFGAWEPLIDRDEVVGGAVRTRPGHSPLFVSPGNGLGVEAAIDITLACCRDGRFLPEPTRRAHDTVTAARKEMTGSPATPSDRSGA